MEGWLEVAAIAFGAQLAVLPGEKVQFIIAALSTRYHPLVVVGAAGSAFAGWTAVEVLVGRQLHRSVPGLYLDVFTGALFLAFTVMLVRSAPPRDDGEAGGAGVDGADSGAPSDAEADGGIASTVDGEGDGLAVTLPVVGRIPSVYGNFLPIFALMAAGEFGDKTQMVTLGLAVNHPHPSAIWAGEMAAILPISLVNALVFHRFSHSVDLRLAHYVGAALFAFFGLDTLQAVVTGTSSVEVVVATATRLLPSAV